MRESIGGAWLMSIVIVFIVLFTSFLAISVNYSKAFKVKNGIINILEKGQGFNNDTKDEIEEYLATAGYAVYGTCDVHTDDPTDPDEPNEQEEREIGCMMKNNSLTPRFKYCIRARQISADTFANTRVKVYYKVTVFFRIDLPVVGNILTFPISGETKTIYTSSDIGNMSC